MTGVLAVALVFGVLAVLVSFSRWLAGHHWAAAGNLSVAVVVFVLVRNLWPATDNLATYQATPEAGPIAQLACERTGPRSYRVTLTHLPGGHMRVFEMQGDEWRLDVRTLAWRDEAASLGLRWGYRLDRLSARYGAMRLPATAATASTRPPGKQDAVVGTANAMTAPAPSSYGLADQDEAGEDVWAQARTGSWWASYADARHAYGPWRPLADAGRFDIWLRKPGADGTAELEARPANEAAAKAVQAHTRATLAAR
jgi:hypothetical protein